MNKKNHKDQLEKSWESFKKAWKGIISTVTELSKAIWNTVKWTYHLVDAWDQKLHSKLWKSSNKITDTVKKNIIKILIASSVLYYWWNKVHQHQKDKKIDNKELPEHIKDNTINLKDINNEIPTPNSLKWRNVWDLYSHYLWYQWVSKTIWDTIIFKPNEILQELYQRKFNRKNESQFTVAKDFYENTVSKIDFDIVEPSSLELLTKNINSAIKEINNNFDWDKFWNEKLKWNQKKIKLFKNICSKIDKESLLAYGMTELMPSPNWELNKEVLDFLLKIWWEKFVMNLPAVADDYTSFGLYQFTSFAVYDTWDEQRWASIMNLYLPERQKIAWSVTKLKWQDHHKTAYLFAMYNLYTLIFHADWEMMKALEFLTNQSDNNDLTQLIAIMHNLPSSWKIFLLEWYKLKTDEKYLYNKTHNKKWKEIYDYDINKNGKIDLYESFLTPKASHNYWKKTYYNKDKL